MTIRIGSGRAFDLVVRVQNAVQRCAGQLEVEPKVDPTAPKT